MNTKNIIQKYLSIIATVFLLFLLGRIFYDSAHKKMMLEDQLNTMDVTIHQIFDNSKELLVKNFTILSTHFMNSPTIANYIKNDEREKLHTILEQDYEDFKKLEPNLFVMHFFDTKNITILRMHKPQSYGDDLTAKRPIVAYVNKSQKTQTGFEVGKNGLVYRITTPFIYKSEHIGVLEFGIKLEYFTQILEKRFGVTNAQLVKTKDLDVLLAQKDYKQLGSYSLVNKPIVFNDIINEIDLNKHRQIINHDGKTYMLFSIDIEDYTGKVVSKILSLKDISNTVIESNHWFAFINISSIFVYISVLVLMYIVLTKFALEIRQNITTIKRLHNHSKRLHTQANTDELTQIYNKRYFNQYLKFFIESKTNGCLMIFDIDHFKQINDTHGHLVGDKILQALASKVKAQLRSVDLFARWGGEEFVILLNGTNKEQIKIKAETIRKSIASEPLYKDITITISIGVACIEPESTATEVLKIADDLLYEAKQNGRNCVVM